MIIVHPDPCLRLVSTNASRREALMIILRLKREINNITWGNVVGLAAPQIGINKRVFIAENKMYINPLIVISSGRYLHYREGCYSLGKDTFYDVKRTEHIFMKWVDMFGIPHKNDFYGKTAEIIQHEYDHLEGVLLIDHQNIKEQSKCLY